jgi:hypothetical protein
MTDLLSTLRTRHADIQNIVNFTLLLLTLMLGMYVSLTNYELELMRSAV